MKEVLTANKKEGGFMPPFLYCYIPLDFTSFPNTDLIT